MYAPANALNFVTDSLGLLLYRPGSDFLAWKTRVLNIIVGATFAMAISWLILPYYASDAHLSLLADAYCGAGKFIEDVYDALYCNFQAAAEVMASVSHALPCLLS